MTVMDNRSGKMKKTDYLYMNTTALAFMGDAVYETYVREYLVRTGKVAGNRLHREAVKYVNAEAQSKALRSFLNILTEDELNLVKRARNKRISTKPKNADPIDYKWATAFEAFIGYLYLTEDKSRMEEIIEMAMASVRGKNV